MFALSLKEKKEEVYLLFEKDFYFSNRGDGKLKLYNFNGSFEEDGLYLKDFTITEEVDIIPRKGDLLHMRIDPPFDTRYLRYLWMLRSLRKYGVEVLNSPEGILTYNEKLYAYEQEESLESYIGSSINEFEAFISILRASNHENIIMKPLDLYQGIGVEKIALDDNAITHFKRKVEEFKGPVVVQPFAKKVESGEIRSLYFKGKELGSILKVPPKGEFLANIAQGATYSACELNEVQSKACERICNELMQEGVDWVAFDVLGDHISEVNITCPGLLVEVSKAVNKNLAFEIIDLLD
jgi:glutathione synthase